MIIRTVLVTAAAVIGLSSAVAQSDKLPSTKLMSEQSQYLYRGLNLMVKGETPYDQGKADELFGKLIETAAKIPAAFPESSKGHAPPDARYSASPKVWENKADFEAHAAKLAKTLHDNRSKAKTLDGLKAAYSEVNGACNSCHDTYRLRKG